LVVKIKVQSSAMILSLFVLSKILHVQCIHDVPMGAPGATGATGATGGTGVTGPTGPTSPTVTANYLSTGNNGNNVVGQNTPLDLGNTVTQNGTAIQRSGATDITLAANQAYSVCYSTNTILAPIAGIGQSSAVLTVNGNPIPGTQSSASGTAGDQANLSTCAIASTTMTSTLELRSANNAPGNTTFYNTVVSVFKLA